MGGFSSYADLLRSLGLWLDERGARVPWTVHTEGSQWAISWDTGGGAPRAEDATQVDVQELRVQAPRLRGVGMLAASLGERAELLRTLGQDLDAERLTLTNLTEEEDAFLVCGQLYGQIFFRRATREELRTHSLRRRSSRQATSSTTT